MFLFVDVEYVLFTAVSDQVIKERLVRVRRELPERMKPLKSLVSQVESLEHGMADLNKWISEGEALIDTHKVDGNINSVEDRLDKHKVCVKL